MAILSRSFGLTAASMLLLSCPSAKAQDASPVSTGDEIVVTGTRVSTLDLKRLRSAQQIFRSGRATFAPTSTLWFQLRPSAGTTMVGMTLYLRNGDQKLPVAIDAEGRFSLPDIPEGRWELVHNRGAARIAVRAVVLSAGADETDRPLGDLRLQCRVGWELKKSNYSFVARGGFEAIGGCASDRIAFYFATLRPIASALATEGSRTTNLPISQDHAAYRAPLDDKTLSNAAKIHVSYIYR